MKDTDNDMNIVREIRKDIKKLRGPKAKKTLRNVIKTLFLDIQKMRDEGYSWTEITEVINKNIKISQNTLKAYFRALQKEYESELKNE